MPAEASTPPQVELTPDIRVRVNMGRETNTREELLAPENPVVAVLGETGLFGAGTEVVPLDVDSSTMPKVGTLLTQPEWISGQIAEYNLVSSEGVKNPRIVQELLGEGFTAEEIDAMTGEQFYHVVAESLNGLPEAHKPDSRAVETVDSLMGVPTSEAESKIYKTGVPVMLGQVDDFVAHVINGGSFTADGESRSLKFNPETRKYRIIKSDGTPGAVIGSEERVRQMIESKTKEQPGRFTF